MRREEFKEWLTGRMTHNSINTYAHGLKRFEEAAAASRRRAVDLDSEWTTDRFADLYGLIGGWRADHEAGGTAAKALFPESGRVPQNLSSLRSYLKTYGTFADGGDALTLDGEELERLRRLFLARYPDFEPAGFALDAGGYWDEERGYKDKAIADCRALVEAGGGPVEVGRAVFEQLVPPPQGLPLSWRTRGEVLNAPDDLAARFYEVIGELVISDAALEHAVGPAMDALAALRKAGIAGLRHGEVLSIAFSVHGTLHPDAAAWFKVAAMRSVARQLTGRDLFAGDLSHAHIVDSYACLMAALDAHMREEWDWEPRDLFDVQGFLWGALSQEGETDVLRRFFGSDAFRAVADAWDADRRVAFETLARSVNEAGLDWWHVDKPNYELRFGRKPLGAVRATAVMGYVSSEDPWLAFNTNIELPFATKALASAMQGSVRSYAVLDQAMAGRVADLLTKHTEAVEAWKANKTNRPAAWPDQYRLEDDVSVERDSLGDLTTALPATNLILYGPPGTGKTHRTAHEAVRLCGEEPPADRAALMARYRALSEAGRIEFVTFHQSMAYEDFVEGLRPSATNEEGEPLAGGFRLVPTPGLFRRIARRAETSTGSGDGAFQVGDRKIFKMSLGDATNPDDAHLFEDAVEDGHIVLGFDDVDWSDPRFEQRDAITAAAQERAIPGTTLNAQSAAVQMPNIFRNWMRKGDVVVVSKGLRLFRAVGVITGSYRFAPREGGDYGHRRDVRWLWVDRAGVPVEEIYERGFTQRTTYVLDPAGLNLPALERYANSQAESGTRVPQSFVLVIDEINRADVSKVFGELITLLEPDKRLGETDALTVRLPYSGETFGVPANLHIVGTMNTADRSIALLDTALRRRFRFEELMPDPGLLGIVDGIDLPAVLRSLNDRIEYLYDREHQVGHAYFMGCRTRGDVDDVMRHRVIPLLAEYFHEDWSRVAAVLGDPRGGAFLRRETLRPPVGTDATTERERVRWTVLPNFLQGAYQQLVSGPAGGTADDTATDGTDV